MAARFRGRSSSEHIDSYVAIAFQLHRPAPRRSRSSRTPRSSGLPESVFGRDDGGPADGDARRLVRAIAGRRGFGSPLSIRQRDSEGCSRPVRTRRTRHSKRCLRCRVHACRDLGAGERRTGPWPHLADRQGCERGPRSQLIASIPHRSTPATVVTACDTLLHVVAVSRPQLRAHLEAASSLAVRIGRQLRSRR